MFKFLFIVLFSLAVIVFILEGAGVDMAVGVQLEIGGISKTAYLRL